MHKTCKQSCTILLVSILCTLHLFAGEEGNRSMKYTSGSKREAIAWQNELRRELFHILKLDDLISGEKPIPFHPKVLFSEEHDNYTLQEIEINTTPGRRMRVLITLPVESSRPCPAVVCIHGHGADRHAVYDTSSIYRGFASALARKGYATISADVGQHEVYEKNRILMGERLWDLMRCVDYLESLSQVDRSRIGCGGLSLGGEMAMWLGAMDQRIYATVSSGFLTKMDQMEQNHCMCWKFPGLRELADFADIYSLIAPRPLQCQNGLKEPPTQFTVALAREALEEIGVIYADLKHPENVALVAHEGGHVIDLPSLMMFFENTLRTGNTEVFFISPAGNDSWSGRLADINTDRTDGPFATLERARDAVRQLRKSAYVNVPLHIKLRGGSYCLDETFILKPEDSGTGASPTIYESYPGETAVISGGKVITEWQKDKGGLWKAKIPEAKSGEWYFRQLYVNGNRRYRPRYPEEGLFRAVNLPPGDKNSWMAFTASDNRELSKRAFKYEEGNLQTNWHNIEDVEVVISQFWMQARLKIQDVNEKEQLVLFTGGSWRPLTWSFGYHVENVFEEIHNEPCTWYLDKAKGELWYHPSEEEDMNRAEVIAPRGELQQLIRLEGDVLQSDFIKHICFRNLTFSHTPWEIPSEGHACTQAEINLQAAILADGACHCSFQGCEFKNTGAWCIDIRKGCRNTDITGNTFTDVGAGAIKIGEPGVCELDIEETRETVISDNYLRDMGRETQGAAGIWIGQSSKNIVSYNDISGSLMWGVSVGWTWSFFPLQKARDNTIEYNYIHDLGLGPLGSHAAIYALGTSPGTNIRNNYLRNVYGNDNWGSGEGIILDNGCFGIIVENNIVYNAVAGGYGSNYNCSGNFIHNNIFLYGTIYQLTVYGDIPESYDGTKGEVFSRNIVVWREGPLIKEGDWPGFETLWDYNVYYNETKEPVTFLSEKNYTIEQWKEKGIDIHSVVADPLLVDPEHGDFSLKPGSPALKLGFKPIDISRVGPRK